MTNRYVREQDAPEGNRPEEDDEAVERDDDEPIVVNPPNEALRQTETGTDG